MDETLFHELLEYLHDELPEDDNRQLEARLKQDPNLAAQLLLVAQDEARLVDWAQASSCNEPQGNACRVDENQAGQHARVAVRHPRIRWMSLVATGAIASCIALVLAGLDRPDVASTHTATSSSSSADQGEQRLSSASALLTRVAHVSSETGTAEWYIENRGGRGSTDVLAGDTLRVNAGQVSLTFDHGTVVTLKSPAVFQVNSSMNARIYRGNVRVLVADGAEGFQLTTPMGEIVDLGTEFVVGVDDGGLTDVAVLNGAVDVTGGWDSMAQAMYLKRLHTGEAVRLALDGTLSRISTISHDRFPESLRVAGIARRATRPAVILYVKDNIQRNRSFKFYEVIRGGMGEDALAFVDRPDHNWNGVDPGGMPAYLVGGDYIRTFNNDKLSTNVEVLELTVTLSQPAMLYVLLDERVPVPEWLTDDFENTGDVVGLDEGPYPWLTKAGEWHTKPTTGRGPGNSIETEFTIWKRQIDDAGVVHLGGIERKDGSSDFNMYGVVAVPLAANIGI